MARAIAHMKLGDPQVFAPQLLHKHKPTASPGCILVRLTHRPINIPDLMTISTRRLFFPRNLQPIIGSEGFGLVDEIGEGVTKFKPGQRVVPLVWIDCMNSSGEGSSLGSWQDYIVLSENEVVAVPDSVSDEVAAQSVINPWTVYGLLDDLAVPEGKYLLQTAAGSVLGRQLIQLAKHRGIKTINIVRREEWKDELMELGADEVVNSETEDIVARVREITGGELAYAAIDAVAGTMTKSVAASVRDGGKVLVYGLLSGFGLNLSILDMIRGVQVSWWMITNYVEQMKVEKRQHIASEVMQLLEKKIITPLAGKKFPLEDFKAAIAESLTAGRGGKVLLIS